MCWVKEVRHQSHVHTVQLHSCEVLENTKIHTYRKLIGGYLRSETEKITIKEQRVILRISEMLSNLTWMMVLWVYPYWWLIEYQFSSVAQSCLTLRPHGLQHTRLPFLSPTPEFTQTRVHWVSDAIQPSHPLSSPSSPAFNLSQHQGGMLSQMSQLFPSGDQSIGVSASASVFPMNIQEQFPLGWTGWISLQSKGLSRVFSNTPFKSINSLALNFLYSPTLTSIHDYWKNHSFD